MKNKKTLILLLLAAMASFAGYKIYNKLYPSDIVAEDTVSPLLALYDSNNDTGNQLPADCKHILLRWNSKIDKDQAAQLAVLTAGAKNVLVTVEVWPSWADKSSKENVLSLIGKGNYDEKIKSLAAFLNKQNPAAMVRFNPDMEVYVGRYPWQMQGAVSYANAFNHFAEVLKSVAPSVKMVWAPAGYPGTEEYWPGAKWVDMVSVTLKGASEAMTDNYPEDKPQSQLIFRKLHRLRFFGKPALVIGSEKLGRGSFIPASFDSAVHYLQANKAIEYMDVNAADKKPGTANMRKPGGLITGVFDPFDKLVDSVPVTVEHVFVNLEFLKSGSLKKKMDSALVKKRNLIITMEPWRDKALSKDPELIENILAGKYDSAFNLLYSVISSTGSTVYLRWLHEMEIPITRYPWQSKDPIQYIKAYRYFVNYIKSKKPANIFFVWGPAGDRGSMEFWPGSDVVDYTSIAIYGLPDKNITDHNKQESFNTIFNRKYKRIWFAHKPLFITEFGVKGPASFKKEWLAAAASTIEANTEITGVSYFNDADNPKAWGNIEAPDWSVTPALFNGFLLQLKTSFKH
jgi:beta-mannanase